MDKQSLLIYPFSAIAMPTILYFERFCSNWKIDAVILPPAYCHLGESIGDITNRAGIIHKTIEEKYVENLIAEKNGILILQYLDESNTYVKETSLHYMEIALRLGKKVLCAMMLNVKQQQYYKMIGTKNGGQFVYFLCNELLDKDVQSSAQKSHYLNEFPFTVFVDGVVDTTYDLEITLSLIHHLRKTGAKVSGLTAGVNGKLFNLHSVDFVNAQMETNQTIEMLAKHLRDTIAYITVNEQPDIIVIQLPDPLVKFSNTIPNGYGIMTYIYNCVIRPDLLVSSLPSIYGDSDMANKTNEYLKKAYGYEVDCFFQSNYLIDFLTSEQLGALSGVFLPFVDAPIQVDSSLYYNLLEPIQMEQYVKSILNRFTKSTGEV